MKTALAVTLSCLIVAMQASAQSKNATVSGVVSDSAGNRIAGATIVAVNKLTDAKQVAESDAMGRYSLPELPRGSYQIRAERPGFRSQAPFDVEVEPSARLRLNFLLEGTGTPAAK